MIITIDGPAGAGKSSAARELARRLGFEFLDTGAMYRAVTFAALRAGVDVHDHAAVAALLPALHIDMPQDRVLLNGENVTGVLRTADITAASGPVADNAAVRRRLGVLQREIAAGRDMVCEGRDQGTVVFPDSACKFFLIADPAERARRRQREMQARGEVLELPEVLKAQEIRDRRDAQRDLAPMKPADDAVILDSTVLSLNQVVDLMEQAARPMSPWKYNLIYEGFRAFTYGFVTLGFSYRSEGKANVPHNGPLLIVANHQSWFDPFLVGLAIRRRIRFMARRTLFTGSRGMNAFLSGLNIIPVNQEGFAREGLRLTRERLDAGEAVLIFPEGQRTWDGQIGKLMPGVTLLIRQTGADVLPVGIAGAWDAWPRWKLLPAMSPLFLPANRASIAVSVGAPVSGKHLAAMERDEMLKSMSELLHTAWARARKLRRRL